MSPLQRKQRRVDLSPLFEPDYLAEAEEIGRAISDGFVVPSIPVPSFPVPSIPVPEVTIRKHEMETKIIDRRAFYIRSSSKIIDESVPGELTELTIRSPSPRFSIETIVRGGQMLLRRSYAELAELAPQSEWIDAFEEAEDGTFVLHLGEMRWSSSFSVSIRVASGTTFKNIWAVYQRDVT